MITTLFQGILKPYIAAVMSLTMTLASMIPGNMGNYEKLAAKAVTQVPSKTELTIGVRVNVDAIETLVGQESGIPEIPGICQNGILDLNATVYAYTDMENLRLALSFTEDFDDGYAIYLDTEGIAIAPALVETVMTVIPLVDQTAGDIIGIYNKYFKGNGAYFSWNDFFGTLNSNDLPASEEDLFILDIMREAITDYLEVITDDDVVKTILEYTKPILDNAEKYYYETTADGVKAYANKMTFTDICTVLAYNFKTTYSEENAEKAMELISVIIGKLDLEKYVTLAEEYLDEDEMANIDSLRTDGSLNAGVQKLLESEREGMIESYTAVYDRIKGIVEIFDLLATGKTENPEYAQAALMYPVIKPFLDNSYVESVIHEKENVITENSTLILSDGNTEYVKLTACAEMSKYDGKISSSENAIPFDLRMDMDEFENKAGYEDALTMGVNGIELSWNTYMLPGDETFTVEYPYFCITYDTLWDGSEKEPGVEYDDYDYVYTYVDSTAHIIDSSVYFPLRQLVEHAGYEVSWDGEARKAYVTVDGKKTEMTGTIINDRTYVKVRDFEKLGATVEYEEVFYREEAPDDFDKMCYATIKFAK